MTSTVDPDRSARGRSSWDRARTPTLAIAACIVGFGLLLGSCDTTAKVTFPTRSFRTAESSGFIAPANACGQLGVEGNANAKMRFVMISGDNEPIRPEEQLEGGSVNLSGDSLELQDSRLFDYPDLQCTSGGSSAMRLGGPGRTYPQNGGEDAGMSTDAGTDAGGGNGGGDNGDNGGDGKNGGVFYEYDGTCSQSDYTCGLAVDGASSEQSLRRCQKSTNLSVEQDGVNFVADTTAPQLFGVLVENSRSTDGFRPSETVGWQFDFDGDGTAREPVNSFAQGIASDPNADRQTALQQLAQSWENARNAAVREDRETRFAAWPINGTVKPESLVEGDDTWTTDPEQVKAAANALDTSEVSENGANVVEAIIQTLREDYDRQIFTDYDKTLAVFVDGPPEEPLATQSYSLQDAVGLAQQLGVRIFIVHLDSSLETSQIYDDPGYWGAQSEGCSGDGDCANYETCREVRGYSTTANQTVDRKPDGTFCMPQYREDGRLGPIALYSRLSCATKGGYIYVKSATQDLTGTMNWLPYTMDGLWEANVAVSDLESTQQNFAPGRPIRLQSTVDLTAGDTTQTLEFSQIGGNRDSNLPQSGDTRSVLFTGTP